MKELGGRVAVVTGAAGGIGLALARRLHAAGASVMLSDVDQEALDAAVTELGPPAAGTRCDVRFVEQLAALRVAAESVFGPVELLCLNAGVSPSGPVLQTDEPTWRWLVDVNLFGVVNGLLTFGPGLVARGHGHIVITASVAGLVPTPSLGPYSAVKHAVVGLAEVLRRELQGSGVGVSVVCPGVVKTRIHESQRVRPAELPGVTHTDPRLAARYREAVESSAMLPEAVADAVLDALRRERFLVLPSPEVLPLVAERLEELHESLREATSSAEPGGTFT